MIYTNDNDQRVKFSNFAAHEAEIRFSTMENNAAKTESLKIRFKEDGVSSVTTVGGLTPSF